MTKKIIGVVGGGQLCLMLAQAIETNSLPYQIICLDPDPNCPASRLCEQIVGSFQDEQKISELAKRADVVTFEIELAGSKALASLDKPVYPSPAVLKIIQDKLVQAEFLEKHNLPVPKSKAIESPEDLNSAIEKLGLPLMIKARTDSYDGKGNMILHTPQDAQKVFDQFSGTIMAQQFITFDCEVSVMCARGVNGDVVTYPVAENIHGKEYNILKQSIIPARVSKDIQDKAVELAKQCVKTLNTVGIFGIEMLICGTDVLINEIAPRVHNTGHYSIEACDVSQFHQHLLAVAGEPLVAPQLIAPAVMLNIIGQKAGEYTITFDGKEAKDEQEVAKGVFVHDYGKKECRENRKMGHVTFVGIPEEKATELFKKINIQMK